jgi:hypothetical protein
MASKLHIESLIDTCTILQEQAFLAFNDLKGKVEHCDDINMLKMLVKHIEPHEGKLSNEQKVELARIAEARLIHIKSLPILSI